MNLRPRRREPIDINLAPLVDVVFLLLIFFMVTTSFKDETRLRVQLPQAQGDSTPSAEPVPLRLVIDRSGNYSVAGVVLAERSAHALRLALAAQVADDPAVAAVRIEADAATPHQAVMTALDAARQAGLARVSFAAIPRPIGETP